MSEESSFMFSRDLQVFPNPVLNVHEYLTVILPFNVQILQISSVPAFLKPKTVRPSIEG